MEVAELATRLVDAGNAEREALLREDSALPDVELAYKLKEICQADWRTEPTRSIRAAAALNFLAEFSRGRPNNAEIGALAKWASGISDLVQGKMEAAVRHLEAAESTLLALGKDHPAAGTMLARSFGLAMLGRYEEAILLMGEVIVALREARLAE